MLHAALENFPDRPEFVVLPASCINFLHQHKIPQDIINDLERCALPEWIQFGIITLVPTPNLIEENTGIIHNCIENGLLALAGGTNGDPIVVDRRDRRIHYVSHDELYSENWSSIDECLMPTPYIYDDFWTAVIDDHDFPCDFNEAQRKWSPNSM